MIVPSQTSIVKSGGAKEDGDSSQAERARRVKGPEITETTGMTKATGGSTTVMTRMIGAGRRTIVRAPARVMVDHPDGESRKIEDRTPVAIGENELLPGKERKLKIKERTGKII